MFHAYVLEMLRAGDDDVQVWKDISRSKYMLVCNEKQNIFPTVRMAGAGLAVVVAGL